MTMTMKMTMKMVFFDFDERRFAEDDERFSRQFPSLSSLQGFIPGAQKPARRQNIPVVSDLLGKSEEEMEYPRLRALLDVLKRKY